MTCNKDFRARRLVQGLLLCQLLFPCALFHSLCRCIGFFDGLFVKPELISHAVKGRFLILFLQHVQIIRQKLLRNIAEYIFDNVRHRFKAHTHHMLVPEVADARHENIVTRAYQ